MTTGLLRLLQITDSSFPVGGYAYSHGLEWLVHAGRVTSEEDLAETMDVFVAQVIAGQWFPAAAAAFRAGTTTAVVRIDERLDASILAQSEREAGRAMGQRLLQTASVAWQNQQLAHYFDKTREGRAPGQFAVAFALAAQVSGVAEADMLFALGFSVTSSVTQAAIRLGAIGPAAAASLAENVRPALEHVVRAHAALKGARIGAFAPGLELAAMLQPTLRFRMFAS